MNYFSPMFEKRIIHSSLVLIFALFSFGVNAQYYYKDIMNTAAINKEFAIIKSGQIQSIKLNSFEENDEPTEGFFCEKKVKPDFLQSEMLSKSNLTGESVIKTDYNPQGLMTRAVTTTPTSSNSIEYNYDASGNVIKITTIAFGDYDSSKIIETHEYTYSANNKPEKMLRKKNNILLSTINFKTDEKGNVIEENATGKAGDKKYYYYYDTKNRLTDIVHFNEIAQKLLPDFMFEYDQQNHPKQMITVDENARNYYLWRYAYNDKNLPEIQKCYSKEKKILGTIEFEYK
jgi:YD repeat-containing protein